MSEFTIVGNVFAPPNSDLPKVSEYCFVLQKASFGNRIPVHQGQYVGTFSDEGFVIGIISEITAHNKYFSDAGTLKELASKNLTIDKFIPAKNWDLTIGIVSVQSFIPNVKFEADMEFLNEKNWFYKIKTPTFPVNPGNAVYLLEKDLIAYILGVDATDIHLGTLQNYDNDVILDINKLFNKHLAILAQSGAGKSYTVSILIEELLKRESATPGLLLIDTHSEYRFFTEKGNNSPNSKFAAKTRHVNGNFLTIGVPNLTEYDFAKFQPNISNPQMRRLRKAIWACRKKYRNSDGFSEYGMPELINMVLSDDENQKVSENLAAWLEDLAHLQIFTPYDNPNPGMLIRNGYLTLIDMGLMISERKKQIILTYLLTRLFSMRRNDVIPPFILFLEEAHNYCPENVASEKAMAKSIIETIAREGRKFYAQLVLITQRPVRLSTTVLSQCNSQIIMRVTNPNDINHIKSSSEHLTEIVNKINILPTGHALLVGAAVNYPVFVKIKQRTCVNLSGERSLKDVCKSYEAKVKFIKGWNDFEMKAPEQIKGIQEGFIEEARTDIDPLDFIDTHLDPVEE